MHWVIHINLKNPQLMMSSVNFRVSSYTIVRTCEITAVENNDFGCHSKLTLPITDGAQNSAADTCALAGNVAIAQMLLYDIYLDITLVPFLYHLIQPAVYKKYTTFQDAMLSNSSESMFKVESSLGPVSKLTRSSKSYDHFNLQAGSMKGAEIMLSLLYPVAITELDLYWLTIKNYVKCGFSIEYERNGHWIHVFTSEEKIFHTQKTMRDDVFVSRLAIDNTHYFSTECRFTINSGSLINGVAEALLSHIGVLYSTCNS